VLIDWFVINIWIDDNNMCRLRTLSTEEGWLIGRSIGC
jgi:hypothetical protein